jgi:hypothetical protein
MTLLSSEDYIRLEKIDKHNFLHKNCKTSIAPIMEEIGGFLY